MDIEKEEGGAAKERGHEEETRKVCKEGWRARTNKIDVAVGKVKVKRGGRRVDETQVNDG